MACDSGCRDRRCLPTGWTRIHPAASFWAAIARPPPRSACCSSPAKFQRPIGGGVSACPAEDQGTIDMPLGRLNVERGWWQKPDPDGQKAVTNWRVLGRGDGLAWLALEPVTGRTHQLRVHSAAAGWPIFGDNIYGNGPRFGEPRLHLHSREIGIPISRNKDPVRVTAPAPGHMQEGLRACGWNGE